MKARVFPVVLLVLAGLVCCGRAWPRAVSLDPHAKQVREQKEDNKRWEKEAKSRESEWGKIADLYYKDKSYRKARKFYRKVLGIRYEQWAFPDGTRDGKDSRRPARKKKTYKLATSRTRRARDRIQKMEATIDQQDLKELMEAAEVAILQENPVKAHKIYDKLIRRANDMGDKLYAVRCAKKARTAQKKLLADVSKALNEVEKLVKKAQADEAKKKLEEVRTQYATLLVLSPELMERFEVLGGTPILVGETVEREVRKKIRLGDAAFKRKDYARAYRHYSTAATNYPATEGGKVAAQKLASLFADPKIRKAMKRQETDAECKVAIARARALIGMGNLAEARAACEKVVIDYPDSKWAQEAADVLATIRQKQPEEQVD